jgi:hypothetical protein
MNSKLFFNALTILGAIGCFIIWGLNHAYPQ